ncbi:MAG: acetate/propionate family kinase [Oxalobacteraceae bacterium]|nr:acetate/propionate family kinase [Oxalobacteraceae bacterium]
MTILAVNAGSSSLKFAVYPADGKGDVLPAVISGRVEGLEPNGQPELRWTDQQGVYLRAVQRENQDVFFDALASLRKLLEELGLKKPIAVAHRIVHGGATFRHSVLVNEEVLKQLEQLNPLAPLHQPHNIAGVRAFTAVFVGVPQVACFDTAFHANAPLINQEFALPQALTASGIRRYGFHGLSYQYIIGVLQQHSERARGRVLMAHLGNGASLCATFNCHSVASTMGFSALDGLMMGTRSGSIDPGVLLYLLDQGYDHDQLSHLLYSESGLLGVSGISADMRALRMDERVAAEHAIDLFTHRIVRESGAMITSMQGLDLIAFSGGIGEHDKVLRSEVGMALSWLGVQIDEKRNAMAIGDAILPIHAPESRVEVWVVPTDEGRVAAREAAALLSGK